MLVNELLKNQSDEYFTPRYAVRPILKYVKPHSKIWCPFDTHFSYFVEELCSHGHMVEFTHIQKGQDFFEYSQFNIPDCEYIISNPPFSRKVEVLEKLFGLDKPFAVLLNFVGLFDSKKKFSLFRSNEFELMLLSRRVCYLKSYSEKNVSHPMFNSVYVCHKMLPKQIVFEEIEYEK